MKKLDIHRPLDIELANEWIAAQKKPHIETTADLNQQIARYNRFQTVRITASTLVEVVTAVFFGYWLSKTPEQINTETISAFSILLIAIWLIVYCLCRPQAPDKIEVFKSVRKFSGDRKDIKLLENAGRGFESHLEYIGHEIAEANRLKDEPEAKRLKKKLRSEQDILLAFGRCKKGWEHYIPEPKKTTVVMMKVDWPTAVN